MKKHILIIGNTSNLQGVEADLENYYRFFVSPVGGLWYDSEITVLRNTTTENALLWLNTFRRQQLDYFIFVFCGHGASVNEEVVMELNNNKEIIYESQVKGVASRQLCIFDCCRNIERPEAYASLTEIRTFSLGGRLFGDVRRRYDERIMQSVPQSACLYACSIGESADGNRSGGYYTYNLLKFARHINVIEFKTVGLCHNEASDAVEKKNPTQHPDCSLPRCLLNRSLIFSIHP